jgi:hypothetical protein
MAQPLEQQTLFEKIASRSDIVLALGVIGILVVPIPKSLTRIGRSLVQEFFLLTEGSQVTGKIRINENKAVADIKE